MVIMQHLVVTNVVVDPPVMEGHKVSRSTEDFKNFVMCLSQGILESQRKEMCHIYNEAKTSMNLCRF